MLHRKIQGLPVTIRGTGGEAPKSAARGLHPLPTPSSAASALAAAGTPVVPRILFGKEGQV